MEEALQERNGYSLIKIIGKGSNGVIWQASKENKLFAVKECNINTDHGVIYLEEIGVYMGYRHPNIIKGYEVFFGQPYF